MSKRSDTKRWLAKHRADPYVKAAQSDNYRSRAAYKLAEIDDKDHLLTRARGVVDLGAAPGGWSQYCRRTAASARVIAIDQLDMDPIDGVTFIKADFGEQAGLDALLAAIGDTPVDLVLSDMAPNLTGVKAADQASVMQLAELSLALCDDVLAPGGHLLIKVFQGEGFDDIFADMKRRFDKVASRKPAASRDASREMYLVGRGWRNP